MALGNCYILKFQIIDNILLCKKSGNINKLYTNGMIDLFMINNRNKSSCSLLSNKIKLFQETDNWNQISSFIVHMIRSRDQKRRIIREDNKRLDSLGMDQKAHNRQYFLRFITTSSERGIF